MSCNLIFLKYKWKTFKYMDHKISIYNYEVSNIYIETRKEKHSMT
jgi:hypothetical protein